MYYKTRNCALFASGVAPPLQYSHSSHISPLLPQLQGGEYEKTWILDPIVNIYMVFLVENQSFTQAHHFDRCISGSPEDQPIQIRDGGNEQKLTMA